MSFSPLSTLYSRILEARARRYVSGRAPSERLEFPVISVGNITMGGTGKTPFVEFLARRFRFEGHRPAILSRGYGRHSRGVVVVSSGEGPRVSPEEGGDEPIELARRLPGVAVVVARRRAEAARAAAQLGANLFILDDGYQHLAIRRDVDLLLLDARDPFGREAFPPLGRLREPLSALSRADAVVFTRVERGMPSAASLATLARWNSAAAVFTARFRTEGLWDETGSSFDARALGKRRFIAVCGVANPSSFAASLAQLDLTPEETIVFSDHRRYRPRDLDRIRRAAERTGSSWLVTTEKDAVKLAGRLSLPLATVRISVEVLEAGFFSFVSETLRKTEEGKGELKGA